MIKIILRYTVLKEDDGKKVGNILRAKLDISSRLLNKLKMNKKILVNETPVFSSHIVHLNDEIEVLINFEETDNILPEEMNLEILYEDDYLLAVNKPFGMVVHPSSYHLNQTLANGVKFYLNNKKKIRAINRLDRDTSGIVLFAKNEYIQEMMIQNRDNIKKEYLALVVGIPKETKGVINAPIARVPGSIMERHVAIDGKTAVTHYELIKILKKRLIYKFNPIPIKLKRKNKKDLQLQRRSKIISLLHLQLETGRTHQIRVHLAYIGNPILGDTLYGFKTKLINRQALHAYKITFIHPINKEKVEIVAPLPKDMLLMD